jgi:List-Bact-rpt repeat protein
LLFRDSLKTLESMAGNPESVEAGAYLLQVGSEGGTVLQRGGGSEGEAAALRDALERPEPSPQERAPALASEIDEASEATSKIEKAVALCKGAAEGHALDPDQLALEVGSLLDCLERLDRTKEHKKALQLARSLATLLMLLKRWASLVQTLRIALRGGDALGDDAAVAWARHELGTLRLAAGDVAGADGDLRRAREIRERIGDRQGLAATNRNLGALCERLRDMVRDEELVRPAPSGRPRLRRALAAVALGAALFVAGIAAGSIAADSGSEPVVEEAAETGGHQPGTGGGGTSGNPGNAGAGNPGGGSERSEYPLVITITGKGTGSVYAGGEKCAEEVCEFEFAAGTTVQFDYDPDEGFEFEGFSGDCSERSCTLTMDAPKAVTASFEPEPGEASGSAEPSGEGETTVEPIPAKPSEPEEETEEAPPAESAE